MTALPLPPPEPPRIWSLDGLAPRMRESVERVLPEITRERVFESVRTDARQAWLYGFGRTWVDAGRTKPVTGARTGDRGWHKFGLAVDIVEDDATPWVASTAWWRAYGEAAERHGLKWGGRWKKFDLPHSQWGKAPVTPTPDLVALYYAEGIEALWRRVGAA